MELPMDRGLFRKHYRKALRAVGSAIEAYRLIEEGDHILVAVSGGKDSLFLLHILLDLQRKAPVRFQLTAYTLDQGFPGFRRDILKKHFESIGIPHVFSSQNVPQAAEASMHGDMLCAFCSRMRRGKMYEDAERIGTNKIALGHNADDAIETLFLNMFNNGRLAAIPPKIRSDNDKHWVIRPLITMDERAIILLTEALALPVIPGNLCGMADRQKRQELKQWLNERESVFPGARGSLKNALSNVQSRYLWDKPL